MPQRVDGMWLAWFPQEVASHLLFSSPLWLKKESLLLFTRCSHSSKIRNCLWRSWALRSLMAEKSIKSSSSKFWEENIELSWSLLHLSASQNQSSSPTLCSSCTMEASWATLSLTKLTVWFSGARASEKIIYSSCSYAKASHEFQFWLYQPLWASSTKKSSSRC